MTVTRKEDRETCAHRLAEQVGPFKWRKGKGATWPMACPECGARWTEEKPEEQAESR